MKKNIGNWGNYPVIESNEESFVFNEQLDVLIKEEQPFIPRGNGRCYGDASLGERTISTLKYDKILSFDTQEGIFECQSGITLDQVLTVIVPAGWFLPVTPGTKFITMGGALGSDVHGKNHHVDGSISNHVTDFDLLLASGEMVTCSPENYPDLFEATFGGMGLTGVITRVKFKLKKIETSLIRQKQIKAANLQELIALFDEYKDYTYSVAWIDCLKKGKHFGRSILMLGEHATLAEIPENDRKDPLKLPKNKQIVFPFNLPSWFLNSFTVKAFNFLYYSKNFKKEINNVVSYEPFFYPLDAVLHWNRMYGTSGFVQYQFVLPLTAKEGLIEILHRISDEGLGSFLAVLKVFGKQESMISFPKEGYTLALDFPVRKGLLSFLDELDELVLKYHGRLYMSKDARMKPGMLVAGYPELEKFKKIIKKYNPDGKIRSAQSDRLLLTAGN
ncbi:FAD-binding oxidoreductase [Mucilaginibacter gotjawali]|uniref:FAD/FMN-containing dehydrogenase n=2 Tax=Mucilaginibacter gotjawali TaxID=1550579 RepID=A0A839SDL6_9SPHI|nr:FAD-binding oxidoreductase [Mucilaginibacter gotjawali]MBB3056311.1 FAD/FMN-containing dehydrogenase [Mucilaginibacter gotjawali]BAU55015.1 putative decaprenylphosphoryl-beta-D-ribose oxidase [Mucilaginibacter gotjawali]